MTTTIEELAILKTFCADDPDSTRWESLLDTFVQGGYRYATDGRVAICIKTDEPDTPLKSRRIPNMASCFRFDTKSTLASDQGSQG